MMKRPQEIPVPVLLEKACKRTTRAVVTTDLCFKSGHGTPMYSKRGQSTIPEKLVFREKSTFKRKNISIIPEEQETLNPALIYGASAEDEPHDGEFYISAK